MLNAAAEQFAFLRPLRIEHTNCNGSAFKFAAFFYSGHSELNAAAGHTNLYSLWWDISSAH